MAIELRTKKIVNAEVINTTPQYSIRVNLENNNIRVSQDLYTKLNLSTETNYIGFGLDRERNKYYCCVSTEDTGFRPNVKNLTFTNKKLVGDLVLWFSDEYKKNIVTNDIEQYNMIDNCGVLWLEVDFSVQPIQENSIDFYEVKFNKVESKQVNQTRKLETV